MALVCWYRKSGDGNYYYYIIIVAVGGGGDGVVAAAAAAAVAVVKSVPSPSCVALPLRCHIHIIVIQYCGR